MHSEQSASSSRQLQCAWYIRTSGISPRLLLHSNLPTCLFQRFNCKNGAAYITTCTYPVEARFICLLYGSSTQQVVFKRLLTPNRLLFPFLLCIKVCSRCRTALFVSLEDRRTHTHSYNLPPSGPFFSVFLFAPKPWVDTEYVPNSCLPAYFNCLR